MYPSNPSSTVRSSDSQEDDSSTLKNTDSYDQPIPNKASTPTSSLSPKQQIQSTVGTLDRQYHVFTQRLLLAANICKQPSKQVSDIEPKAFEVIEANKELKNMLMKMETVVRGNEEEMKEIKLAAESSGSVGLKRKHRLVES
jgi:hypothetical protein